VPGSFDDQAIVADAEAAGVVAAAAHELTSLLTPSSLVKLTERIATD